MQLDSTVEAQNLIMGEMLPEQRIEIIESLEPGDRIVLKGAAYLKDGDKIAIAEDSVSTTGE